MNNTEEILHSLSTRRATGCFGIGVAKSFLSGFNPADFDVSPEQWAKHLDDAASQLTYSNSEYETKGFKDDTSLMDGAILEFDGICSTKSKDRDGDVIQSNGLVIDHKMPLLFSHNQTLCVGKHASLIEQNDRMWASHWAIAETTLGKDCAVLVKFGALRLSIGFKPLEYEPLTVEDDGHGGKFVTGWLIKKAAVMETSLVSIPANAEANILQTYAKEFDAICTAISRGELKHDAMKHWAKNLSDKRPVQVQGVTLKDETQVNKDSGGGELPKEQDGKCSECGESKFDLTGTCQACGHVKDDNNKAAEKPIAKEEVVETKAIELATKGLSHYPKGSYEQVQDELGRTASKYLKSKADLDEYWWTNLYATFEKTAVICVYYGEGKSKCYSVGWKETDGIPHFDGDVKEVDVEPAIISKYIDQIETKNKKPSLAEMALELSAKAYASANQDEADAALQIVEKTIEARHYSRGLIQF